MFSAPASNGGVAITGYTVTASSGGFTGTGSSSPISVAGLAKGTSYTFTVMATNSIGTGAASAMSNSVTAVNPSINLIGRNIETSLTTNTGFTPTRAPSNVVTNLDKLNNNVGISDGGTLVIAGSLGSETLKLADNTPNNVLIGFPSRTPVNVQLNGSVFNIQVDPETANPSSPTIISTTTLTLPNGSTTKSLQLLQGETTIGNTQSGGIIGGMELSKDTTLHNVVAQAGPAGGTAGFNIATNGLGSVSAESGEVQIKVALQTLSAGALAVSTSSSGHTLNALTTDTVSITLEAGEVARFDANGNLTGVYLGSLSGNGGKTDDALALITPVGINSYPAITARFEGGNVLGRTGTRFSDFMNSQQNGSMQFNQLADGLIKITSGNHELFARLVGSIQVTAGVADGTILNPDNSLSMTFGGLRSSYQPILNMMADFASYMKATYNFTTGVLDNGLLKLASNTDSSSGFYMARPHYEVLQNPDGKMNLVVAEPGKPSLEFVSTAATRQRLEPAFYDQLQVRDAAIKLGWTLSATNNDGTNFVAISPSGQSQIVVPNFHAEQVSIAQAAAYGGTFRMENGTLYFYYKDQPLRQQLLLQN